MGFNFDQDWTNGEQLVYIDLPEAGKSLVEILITKSNVVSSIQMLGSPGERGIMKFDNRTALPTTAHVEGFVTNLNYKILKKIADLQRKETVKDTLCVFHDRDGMAYENMVITRFSKTSTADRLNLIQVTLDMQEFMFSKSAEAGASK